MSSFFISNINYYQWDIFALLQSNIAEDVEAYMRLRWYIENCGKFLVKYIDLFVCADDIDATDNEPCGDGTSNQMRKYVCVCVLPATSQRSLSKLWDGGVPTLDIEPSGT